MKLYSSSAASVAFLTDFSTDFASVVFLVVDFAVVVELYDLLYEPPSDSIPLPYADDNTVPDA